jgi:hypothetical protein
MLVELEESVDGANVQAAGSDGPGIHVSTVLAGIA